MAASMNPRFSPHAAIIVSASFTPCSRCAVLTAQPAVLGQQSLRDGDDPFARNAGVGNREIRLFYGSRLRMRWRSPRTRSSWKTVGLDCRTILGQVCASCRPSSSGSSYEDR